MARIAFVIRSLTGGGAERQLLALARGLSERGHHCAILTWISDLAYPEDLRVAKVTELWADSGDGSLTNIPFLARRIGRVIKSFKPDLIHGYLDTGNFFASTSRIWAPQARIAWGLRASDVRLEHYDKRGQFLAKTNALFSYSADVIIANSHAGAAHAVQLGYPAKRLKVVPNGIDSQRFRPDPLLRHRGRQKWGWDESVFIIGIAARLDPMKDYPTFLQAAQALVSRRQDVRFVCVGEGVEPYRSEIISAFHAAGLGEKFIWEGFWQNMPAFYNAVDLITSTSLFGEGFSNSIAEAMACGTPCVVTDVGDSALIIGSEGAVVSAGDPAALVLAWEDQLAKLGPQVRMASRMQIIKNFSITSLIRNTERALHL